MDNLTKTISAIAFSAIFAATGNAQLINVNFNGFTGGNLQSEIESTLEGPAGGLGTSWNQYADEDSTGVMVDSTGASTTVTFETDFTESRTGNTNELPIFRSTLTDFGRGASRTLTINGLDSNALYDVWIAAYRDPGGPAVEYLWGDWSTSNPTTSPATQVINGTVIQNGATFEEGVNYALFEDVEADGDGTIEFNGQGMIVTQPISGDDYRLGLSGFQIMSAGGGTGPIVGDYDNSGTVAQGDLDIVLLNWGTANFTGDETKIPGGGPFDGTISQNELDGVLLNWGNTSLGGLGSENVPEPSSVALMAGIAGLAMLFMRKRH